ncbi:DUF2812 domain-containing protein [Streptococcus cameli]
MTKFNPRKPEQMEAYFRQMHQEGWAVKNINPFTGKIEFVPCQAEDVIYKLDIYTPKSQWELFLPEYDGDYKVLFESAGWQMVSGFRPYVLFKKAVASATCEEELELYSDRTSFADYRKKVFRLKLYASIIPFIPLFPTFGNILSWKLHNFLLLGLVFSLWAGYVGFVYCQYQKEKQDWG